MVITPTRASAQEDRSTSAVERFLFNSREKLSEVGLASETDTQKHGVAVRLFFQEFRRSF